MTQEILYTSAPRGLKPGSRGFCTVVSTEGMAGNLAQRLESLSGYRHAFPLHDSRSKFNPVNESHLIVAVGGTTHHVLSRIADAGEDYTGRSNKIAHHVALQKSELNPAGPAAVLSAPGFCETKWDGQPRILTAGRRPDAAATSAGPCNAWQRITGDAGWAGVLAESAVKPGGRPMSVIFPAGTRTLPLVEEALSLLPPEHRWDVTFSTYFTKLPAGVDCRWRFLLDESPEAAAIRRNPHAPVIDLCDDLPAAKGGDLVEAARTGARPAVVMPTAAPRRKPGRDAPPPPPDSDDFGGIEPYELEELEPTRRSPRPPLKQRRSQPRPPGGRRALLLGILLGVGFLVVLASGLTAGYFWGHASATTEQAKHRPSNDNNIAKRNQQPGNGLRRGDGDVGKTDEVKNGKKKSDRRKPIPNGKSLQVKQAVVNAPNGRGSNKRQQKPKGPPKPHALQDIRDHNNLLTLPNGNKWKKLAQIKSNPQDVELEIHGGKIVIAPKSFRLSHDLDDSEKKGKVWKVSAKSPGPGRGVRIAEFKLDKEDFSFRWIKMAGDRPEARCFRFCILELRSAKERELCRLWKPHVADQPVDISLDFSDPVGGVPSGSHMTRLPNYFEHIHPKNVRIKWAKNRNSYSFGISHGHMTKKQTPWTDPTTVIRKLLPVSTPLFNKTNQRATIHFSAIKVRKGISKLTLADAFADLEVELVNVGKKGTDEFRSFLKLNQYFYPSWFDPISDSFVVSTQREFYAKHRRNKYLTPTAIEKADNIRHDVSSKIEGISHSVNDLDESIATLEKDKNKKGNKFRNGFKLKSQKRRRTELSKQTAFLRSLLQVATRSTLHKNLKKLFNKKNRLHIELYIDVPIKHGEKTIDHKTVTLFKTKPAQSKPRSK